MLDGREHQPDMKALLRNYRQYYESRWPTYWNEYLKHPVIGKILCNGRVQQIYGRGMGYYFVLSLNLFDREINFDQIFKINNYCIGIKILDDIIDNGFASHPMELLDSVCQDSENPPPHFSELESHAFKITKMVMSDIGYSSNPGLQKATFKLKESAKKSLIATNFNKRLKAEYDTGYYGGKVAAYALIPDINPGSSFMAHMQSSSILGTSFDNIKNIRNDMKNLHFNGNLASYICSSALSTSENTINALKQVPYGKKLEFIKILMYYIGPLMSNLMSNLRGKS